MARFLDRSAMIIVLCYLSIYANDSLARSLKGTIKDGKYFAPDQQFSFHLSLNGKVEEKSRVIPVSHFYQRAFYPVPSEVEIPRKSEWFKVSFVDNRGLSNEIHSLPLGDRFSPLSHLLHRSTTRRFLQDLALPAWRSSVSRESWLGDGEYLKLDGIDVLKTSLLVPGKDVKSSSWKPAAGLYLHFGTLTFIRGNHIYMLVQSSANYRLHKPRFVDPNKSLEELYRAITFKSGSGLASASIASGTSVR